MEYRWHNEWLNIEYRFKYALKEVMALRHSKRFLKRLWRSLSNTTKLYMLGSLHIEVCVSNSSNSRATKFFLTHFTKYKDMTTWQHKTIFYIRMEELPAGGSVHWCLFAATLCIPTIQITHPSRWQGAHICNLSRAMVKLFLRPS